MKHNTKYEILTPNGFESFDGVQRLTKSSYYHIEFTNDDVIDCSSNHRFLSNNEWLIASTLKVGDGVTTKDKSFTFVESITFVNEPIHLYDVVGVRGDSSYITNNIVSHNCDFLGSSGSLINATTMGRMVYQTPIMSEEYTNIYYPPQIGHQYAITVDPAEGLGLDSSVCVVSDITEIPYQQVAIYRNNAIDPNIFPDVIYNLAMRYNQAFVLVEANNIGSVVCNILHYTLEYENLVMTATKGRSGQVVSGGYATDTIIGVKTTPATKRIGCSIAKSLIESDQYIINDFDTIKEFTTFVRHLNTYQAEEGYNDDICMCIVLFSWLINNQYFKDMLVNQDIRKKIMDGSHLKHLEEALTPFGHIETGLPEVTDDIGPEHLRNGAVWGGVPLT